MEHKNYSQSIFVSCLWQSFSHVRRDISHVVQIGQDTSTIPGIEKVAASEKIQGHDMMESHFDEIIFPRAYEMCDETSHMVTHRDQKILFELRSMRLVWKIFPANWKISFAS